MQTLCKRYANSMQMLCKRYAKAMHKLCKSYAKAMQMLWISNAIKDLKAPEGLTASKAPKSPKPQDLQKL